MPHTERRIAILREKAQAGDSRAQYQLGLTYFRGEGVPQDMKEARVWLTMAAEQGQRDAQVLLSLEGLRLDQGVQFKLGSLAKKAAAEETVVRKNVSVSVPLGRKKGAPPSPAQGAKPESEDASEHAETGDVDDSAEEAAEVIAASEQAPPGDQYAQVNRVADEIEAELRRLGWWSATAPTPQQMAFTAAFAMDTMPLSMWIQFVLLPRVRSIIAERGPFPSSSMVGAHAVREYDGENDAKLLVDLLCVLDNVVTGE